MLVAYNNVPFFAVWFHVTKSRIDWCTIFLVTFLTLANGYTYTTALVYHVTLLTTTTWFKAFNIYTALGVLYIVTCYITSWFCYQYQRFLTICINVERLIYWLVFNANFCSIAVISWRVKASMSLRSSLDNIWHHVLNSLGVTSWSTF